jgi:hypothetical protein
VKPQRKDLFLHPALLFAAGNTALAIGHAETVAVSINIVLVLVIIFARFMEFSKGKPFGVPFAILAVVNFITAASVVYVNVTTGKNHTLDYVAAGAYIAWGVGHLLAGRHERRASVAHGITENPQVLYGIGDISAVNASGSINLYSFPFMIIGFAKSVFIGKRIKTELKLINFMDSELTAARIYGLGYFVGAVTSLTAPYFVVAQIFWGLAYFSFRKDT